MEDGLILVGVNPNYPITKYAGFDGVLWPGHELEEPYTKNAFYPLSELEEVIFMRNGCSERDARILLVSENNEWDKFHCIGFDVGQIDNSMSYFSCILHDIVNINGACHDLLYLLNSNGLFENRELASNFIDRRENLPEDSVEQLGSKPIVYKLWEYIH